MENDIYDKILAITLQIHATNKLFEIIRSSHDLRQTFKFKNGINMFTFCRFSTEFIIHSFSL